VNFGVCGSTMIEALGGSQTMSPVALSVRADRSDDPLAPTRGWTAGLAAEHASGATGSDFRYNRITGELANYRRLGPGVLAARVRGGWVHALTGTASAVGVSNATGQLLHPRKRFYAGGSQSVRGFGESQLGPRILTIDPRSLIDVDTTATGCTEQTIANGACDPEAVESSSFTPRPLGGNSLVEGSIEYRIPIGPTLSAAVFVDAASVGAAELDVPAGVRSAITPGFGVRYQSPIGPVRADLGIRPRLREQLPVVTQLTDGNGELRLVRLDSPKLYDPVGPSGGFFRSVFSRLQLHLSIGEAF
jgi:translocation and assembly module TamA